MRLNRTTLLPLLGSLLAACASNPSATTGTTGATGGSIATTGGSIGGSGGSTGGPCSSTTCTTDADCTICGPGYACGMYMNLCCGQSGAAPCSGSTDCCSGYCDADNGTCEDQPGPSTTIGTSATTGASTSGGSIGVAATSTGGSFGTGSTGTSSAAGTTGGTTGATTGGSSSGGSPALAFAWTFGVSQACEQAGAAWMTVALNGGAPVVTPCRNAAGVEGLTIGASALNGAEASYVVAAYDGVLDSQIGQVSGSLTAPLQGTTPVPVTLPLASGQASTLDLSWTFAGLSTMQAAVTSVQVDVTDPKNPLQDIAETLDGGLNGVSLPGFGPATYPVALTGNGPATYQASANVAANGLTPALLLADLPASSSGSAGNVVIDFSFSGQSCTAAGLSTISLQLTNASGSALASPVTLACADAGTSYAFSNVAAPSTAFLWLEGIAEGQAQQLANPQIVISPGATANYVVSAQPAP